MPSNTVTWYKRFADIPEIGYPGDLHVRRRLKGADQTPRIQRYEFDGKQRVSLSWPTREGTSSASPVHELAFGTYDEEAPEATRDRVVRALELPGTPSDYHFLLQGAHEQLWARRRERPDQYSMIEWLCQLDLRLLEVHPETLWIGDDAGSGFFRVIAFDRLLTLYATEAFEAEVLETAARIAQLLGGAGSPLEPRSLVRKA